MYLEKCMRVRNAETIGRLLKVADIQSVNTSEN
jgi:hypothetical protein